MLALLARFLLGGFIYMGIEVAFDNTSHRSMGLIGGLAFVLCGYYDEWFNMPYMVLMLVITITIMILEYIGGKIWNRDFKIWDYRKMPFNFQGQICLTFALVWFFLITHLIIYLDNAFKLLW